jgi:hypothetical protein
MPPLGLPRLSVDPVLYLPLWLGTILDHSGHGNVITGTVAPLHWMQSGAIDGINSPAGGRISMTANSSITGIQGSTLFLAADFGSQVNNETLLFNNVLTTSYYWTTTQMRIRTGPAIRTLATTAIPGSSSIAYCAPYGGTPTGYLDGLPIGAFSGAITMDHNDPTWRVLGGAGGPTGIHSKSSLMLLYPAALSAPEIAELHAYSQARITPRKQWPGGGLRYPGRGDPYTPATGDLMFGDNFQTAQVALEDQASGRFSNTTFDIASGIFSHREDAIGRYAYCVSAGTLRQRVIGADGFDTKLFIATGATITKDATGFDLDFSPGDIVRAVQLTAP